MSRHPNLQDRHSSALVVVDIQERIAAVMQDRERVIDRTSLLIRGFQALDLPIYYTEQYPKGLGPTEPAIRELLGDLQPYEKLTFSVCGDRNLVHDIGERKVRQVVVAGIETHVCVFQSAMDFTHFGFQTSVVADAVTSRKSIDHETALARLRQHGVTITTAEMVLFELLYTAGTEEFKAISKLVK